MWSAAAIVAVLAGLGCDRGDSASTASVIVDSSGDVERVWNAAPSRILPPAPILRQVPHAGGEGLEVGEARSVVGDEDGQIYVADTYENRIYVFDRQGDFFRAFGGEGQGPGEFGRLYALAWLGDTLAALDPGNARISLFDRVGNYQGQLRHQSLTGDPRVVRLYQMGPQAFGTIVVVPSSGQSLRGIVRVKEGLVVDTLPFPESGDPRGGGWREASIRCEYAGAEGIEFFRHPFASTYWAVPGPNGVTATVWTEDYRVHVIGANGDTVRVVEVEYQPVPTTPEEWGVELAEWRERRAQYPELQCDPDDPKRAAYKPAIRLLFFDAVGRMWVEVETAHGQRLDLFDPEGVLVGSMWAPERDRSIPPWADRDRLYVVDRDGVGTTFVAVYDLSGIGGSARE